MKKEIDYIVKAKKENFSLKTDIFEINETKQKKKKYILFICTLVPLILIIPVIIYFISYNSGLGLIGIIFISLLLGVPIAIGIAIFSNNKEQESYNWNLEIKENKIHIYEANDNKKIDFNNLISVRNERHTVGYTSGGDTVYSGYKWYIIIEYLAENNKINTIKLPYKRQYEDMFEEDEEYIEDENKIEELLNIFVTKKQYEENPTMYDKYVEIRNKNEEENFKNTVTDEKKRMQIYSKDDIYFAIGMLFFLIFIIISVIIGQGGK